jgi:GT2 family glycosyltransferase
MSRRPRISVCVPARDEEPYLAAALESALAQRVDGLEVIVYDDASIDRTRQVAAAMDDSRLRTFGSNAPLGVAESRNRCLAAARGEYVAWLDADDVYLAGALARTMDVLDRVPEVGFVHGAFELIDEAGRRLPDWPRPFEADTILPGAQAFAELVLSNYVATASAVVARRRLLERVGPFSRGLPLGEDWEMWLRMALEAPVAYLAAPVVQYRRHAGSATARASSNGAGLSAEAAVLRCVRSRARSRLADAGIWRRADAALAVRALQAAGEALARGERLEAIRAAVMGCSRAGRATSARRAARVLAAMARADEYAVYRLSKAILGELHTVLEGSWYATTLEKVARPDPTWERELEAIAVTVAEVVPPDARALTVDKWDPTLLRLSRRRGAHFPDRRLLPDGYPRDSAEAIEHLEQLRATRGADYLVFPSAAFWWLDFYADFRRHLEERHLLAWRDERCVVYELSGGQT